MATDTKIQWAHDTRNFWWGCEKVSEACQFCYAEEMDKRRGPLFDHGRTHWGPTAPRWLRHEAAARECESSERAAVKTGHRRRVFVNSMSDTFEDHPALLEARAVLFATVERLTSCDWLLLTKRPENILRMVPPHWLEKWPAHVWIGTTTENQKRLDIRLAWLRLVPAAVRFLSCEPLLSALNMYSALKVCGSWPGKYNDWKDAPANQVTFARQALMPVGFKNAVNWVIVGGESGSNRKLNIDWVRTLRDQCRAGGVPVFIKQLGCQPFTFDKPEGVTSWENQNMDVPPRMEHLWRLKDSRHGGDMNEWPADLRVREVPTT